MSVWSGRNKLDKDFSFAHNYFSNNFKLKNTSVGAEMHFFVF